MTTPYDRPARPWDVFNKNLGKLTGREAEERYEICKACPELLPTGNCKKCGCFMQVKTTLPNAECPLGHWGQIRISYKEEAK